MKKFILACLVLALVSTKSFAQTSDDKFRQPLTTVLADIQSRYGISIRYPAALVKDRWVNYAQWRYRPNVEETLQNIINAGRLQSFLGNCCWLCGRSFLSEAGQK